MSTSKKPAPPSEKIPKNAWYYWHLKEEKGINSVKTNELNPFFCHHQKIVLLRQEVDIPEESEFNKTKTKKKKRKIKREQRTLFLLVLLIHLLILTKNNDKKSNEMHELEKNNLSRRESYIWQLIPRKFRHIKDMT